MLKKAYEILYNTLTPDDYNALVKEGDIPNDHQSFDEFMDRLEAEASRPEPPGKRPEPSCNRLRELVSMLGRVNGWKDSTHATKVKNSLAEAIEREVKNG